MSRIWAIATLFSLLAANPAIAAGLLPVPTLTGAQIEASAQEDPVNGWFVYLYNVANPMGNTGEIWNVKIDVLDPANEIQFSTGGLTFPLGAGRVGFSDLLSRISLAAEISPTPVRPHNVVPFGQNVPPGWSGGLGLDGFVSFHSSDETPNIVPGSSLAGFEVLSFGLPSIREAQLIPFWMYVVEDHGVSPTEEAVQAGEIERKLPLSVQTLGPSGVTPGSAGHWNRFRDDLAKAIQLGWITDPMPANTLTAQLASAREAFDTFDSLLVNARVQLLFDTISLSTPEQRNAEAHALVLLNARRLFFSIPIGFEPAIALEPKGAELSIGDRHVITVSVVNRADNNSPLSDVPVFVRVEQGPNLGVGAGAQTDANGRATFGYVGQAIGMDKLVAEYSGIEVTIQDTGEVLWSGGADLTVPSFSPPLLITAGGRSFFLNEETENIGNIASPPSLSACRMIWARVQSPLTTGRPSTPHAHKTSGQRHSKL